MTQATDAVELRLAELLRAGQLPPVAERRRIRIQSGASLRRMGEELGVTATAVHRWEKGIDCPTLENAVRYRLLLDQLAALIDDDGEVAS
jgi:DNA-binding XRE family transcriptional regulator